MIRFFLLLLFFQISLFAEPIQPEIVASLEIEAWKAYYQKDKLALIQILQRGLQEQFHISSMQIWTKIIPYFASAAYQFSKMPDYTPMIDFQKKILPDLTSAYTGLKEALNEDWDPSKAANYELEWWVLRNKADTANPKIVGKAMTQLYQEIYGKNDEGHFSRAAFLRASAAYYHDLCQKNWGKILESDWPVMQEILVQSYQELLKGIQANNVRPQKVSAKDGEAPAKSFARKNSCCEEGIAKVMFDELELSAEVPKIP